MEGDKSGPKKRSYSEQYIALRKEMERRQGVSGEEGRAADNESMTADDQEGAKWPASEVPEAPLAAPAGGEMSISDGGPTGSEGSEQGRGRKVTGENVDGLEEGQEKGKPSADELASNSNKAGWEGSVTQGVAGEIAEVTSNGAESVELVAQEASVDAVEATFKDAESARHITQGELAEVGEVGSNGADKAVMPDEVRDTRPLGRLVGHAGAGRREMKPSAERLHDKGDRKMSINPRFDFRHQQVVLNTACALRGLMESHDGYVVVAPLSLVLSGAGSARIEPDVMVLPADASFAESDVRATPELVVEVVTPESAHDDMGSRRDLYQAAGVREYWLVHLTYDVVQRYTLDETGSYRPEILGEADAISPHFCQLGEVRVSDLLRTDV